MPSLRDSSLFLKRTQHSVCGSMLGYHVTAPAALWPIAKC